MNDINDDWTIERIAKEAPPLTWEPLFKHALLELTHISKKLDKENALGVYYPSKKLIFNALNIVNSNDIKCIIIGKEPYNLINKDQGLCFSVHKEDVVPLTIKNIYKELTTTVKGFTPPNHGCLEQWGKQGVLLLNQCLTVGPKKSHYEYELWYGFINKLFKFITTINPNTIILLWGADAQNINEIIPDSFVRLEAGYPNGYKVQTDFLGCNHFNKVNEILIKQKKTPIDWSLS